jgi:hypothetical protein
MLILISIALLGFGLLLFSFGVAVWLTGLAISNLPVKLASNGHVPGCHAHQNGLLASQRASQAVIPMS